MQHYKWLRNYLEDLFELMNAFIGKNQLVDEEKKIETAKIAATRRKDNFDGKHSNGKVVNHRENDWTNKALARDKHVRRCFVCNSENHLAARCPQNPGWKQRKFEKNTKKREIITQEEESDYNDMSDDSSVSSNNLEEQPSRKVVEENFSSMKKKSEKSIWRGKEPNSEEITTLLIWEQKLDV